MQRSLSDPRWWHQHLQTSIAVAFFGPAFFSACTSIVEGCKSFEWNYLPEHYKSSLSNFMD